ncbi:MAG: hypothetical protein K6F23_05995 [Solobacterium sp.]|nr:hypothetical protein [Solobacterium sp.]
MKNRKLKKSAAAVLAVIIVAVIFAVVYITGRNDKSETAEPVAAETAVPDVISDSSAGQTPETEGSEVNEQISAENSETAETSEEAPVFSPLTVEEAADIDLEENSDFVLH